MFNHRRIYKNGVPLREISQHATRGINGATEPNAPIIPYDTSGVWGDPSIKCDVRDGLPAPRRDWIVARGDVEEYQGREVKPVDNGYLTRDAEEFARVNGKGKLEEFPGLRRQPLRAREGRCVT